MQRSSRYPQLLCISGRFFIETPLVAPFCAARGMLNDGETRALFINLKPPFAFEGHGESPLSGAVAPCCQDSGDCRGGNAPGARVSGGTTGETGPRRPWVSAMLSVPTLWTGFVINFLALGLIWGYVVHSYPAFAPARFWTGSSFVAAAGAAVAMVRVFMTDLTMPLIVGGTALVFAICLGAVGIRTFFDRPASVGRT